MGLLMPLLLGGLALVGLPWLIHRIRKPTNNPTRFSSLMFLPETVPPVRQKKQIEHWWLMALRMLVLCLLALAFARPYVLAPAAADPKSESKRQHVLLVDTSLSTTAGGHWEKMLAAARTRLAELGNDPVGVVTFQETAQTVMGLDEGDAAAALDSLKPTYGATNFLAGIRHAEQLLLPTESSSEADEAVERIIHLVSDLQRSGLSDDATSASLARGVSIRLVPIEPVALGNGAIDAAVLEARAPSTLIARVRLRNYGAERLEGTLEYWMNDALAASQVVSLQAEGGVNIALSTQADLTQPARVELRLVAPDGLAEDNQFYAVYTPDPMRDIGVLLDPAADRAQPIPFLEAALAESQPVPWRWTPVELSALADVATPVLVVPGLQTLTADDTARLVAYVDGGGRLLIVPSTEGFPQPLAEALLAPAGVSVAAAKFEKPDPVRYALISWIDFDDPAFRAFRSAAYSDFSMLRFSNYFPMAIAAESPVHVAARLQSGGEGNPDPAIVAFSRGEGRAVVWAFPLDPEWTNIARTRRFVPLLHETIALLLPPLPPVRAHCASTPLTIPASLAVNDLYLRVPNAAEPIAMANATDLAAGTAPGILQWSIGAGEAPALMEAVNLQPAESDLRAMSSEEFLLRLGAVQETLATDAPATGHTDENVVHWEYGYPLLVLLALAFLLESILAVLYSRSHSVEPRRS